MAWYVVHVGRMPGIYQTWRDCHAQVHRYPGNCYKKYNTQAEALRAYNGVNIQNNNDQELVMEIERFRPRRMKRCRRTRLKRCQLQRIHS